MAAWQEVIKFLAGAYRMAAFCYRKLAPPVTNQTGYDRRRCQPTVNLHAQIVGCRVHPALSDPAPVPGFARLDLPRRIAICRNLNVLLPAQTAPDSSSASATTPFSPKCSCASATRCQDLLQLPYRYVREQTPSFVPVAFDVPLHLPHAFAALQGLLLLDKRRLIASRRLWNSA